MQHVCAQLSLVQPAPTQLVAATVVVPQCCIAGCPQYRPPAPTQPCSQVPRAVDHIFLAPGNRAELLVQCSGAKGSTYVLRAQVCPAMGWG